MIKQLFKLIFCFSLLSFPLTTISQNIDTELKRGTKVSEKIGHGDIHNYTVSVDKDMFVFIELVQNGIDLKINVSLDGKELGEFDSPNFRHGPELISATTSKKGDYLLKVTSIDTEEQKGEYELSIIKIEPIGTTPQKQVDQLFTAWDTNSTPGAAVSVVKDGSIVYKKGYGMSNLEYDIPITPSTVFHIASVSKQFTAFAILLLEKDGKLSLDDDIRKYIPEVPDFGKTITLRHLANHTSGMRDQWNLLAMAGWRLDDVITKEHVIKLVERQKDLNFEPGAEYLYCNTGFTLLAEVVARVSGKTFAEFTEERIFKPLNMSKTLFYDDHEKIVRNRAYSYRTDKGNYKKSVLSYANVGATSLFTTVEDLSFWATNFENPIVGDSEMMQKMKQQAVLNNGQEIGYALGQSVGKYKGLNRVGHGGADAGYRTYIGRFPEQKFSVIVFSNDANFNSGVMAHEIADIYLKDSFIEEKEEEEEKDEEEEEKDEENIKEDDNADSITIDEATKNAYVGDYEIQPGFILTITNENGSLYGQATGQQKIVLVPVSNTEFTIVEVNAKITFNRDGNEKAKSLTLVQGGANIEALRIKEFDKSAVDLSDFTGEFYSEELATSYNFIVENEKLIARHSRIEDIELSPTKKDHFAGNKWFFGQIEFTRNGDGTISGCKVTAGRVRNLKFEKIN